MIGKIKALAAGFVLGLLIAPRSGRASRRLLMEKIDEFFDAGGRRLGADDADALLDEWDDALTGPGGDETPLA